MNKTEAKQIKSLLSEAHSLIVVAALVARDHVPELREELVELEEKAKQALISADNATR